MKYFLTPLLLAFLLFLNSFAIALSTKQINIFIYLPENEQNLKAFGKLRATCLSFETIYFVFLNATKKSVETSSFRTVMNTQ